MENSHKLGLFISYYLSQFNKQAYINLGYGTQRETHRKIGEILQINPNTIKNWRDEFDPIHLHRIGWHQRPMLPSRVNVVRALEALDESWIRLFVKDILSGEIQKDQNTLDQILRIVTVTSKEIKKTNFVLRGITGKKAEEYFISFHKKTSQPLAGELIDCRDLGMGFDFKIRDKDKEYLIEIKGVSEICGGILLTNKEWDAAKLNTENYYLCIVINLGRSPKVVFVQNPFEKLKPKKNIYTTIQVSWSLSNNQLKHLYD